MVETCRRLEVNPYEYLKSVIHEIAKDPSRAPDPSGLSGRQGTVGDGFPFRAVCQGPRRFPARPSSGNFMVHRRGPAGSPRTA